MRYYDWNAAICDYFTKHAAPGSLVYMTVDDAFLTAIGARRGIAAEEAVNSFIDAVRAQVRWGDDAVTLTTLDGRDAEGRPRSAAFLAANVLAAYRMGEDRNPSNFFGQLRSLLRFTGSGIEEGRITGMETGKEEPLWRDWIQFLAERNLLSSARPGEPGSANYYINYPISQTLLRYADREKLKSVFDTVMFFHQTREPDLLMARVFALRQSLTPRLQHRLSSTTAERYITWTQAIADLHEEYLRGRDASAPIGGATHLGTNTLGVELIRQPERVQRGVRTPHYYEFVLKLRPGFGFGDLGDGEGPEIEVNGEWFALEPDEENPSRTNPICTLNPAQVVAGQEFPLRGAGNFTKAVLPKRDFWILFKDEDHANFGIYQTGRPSGAGLSFVFLGANRYAEDLERLRGIEKIGYKSCRPFGTTGWVEVSDGQITHEDWTHLSAGDADLRNALRPRVPVSVSLSGGLRANNKGYLPTAAPRITVRGAAVSYSAKIVSLRGDKETTVWAGDIKPFEEQPVPNVVMSYPGLYRIDVGNGDQTAPRLLSVADWNTITATPDDTLVLNTDPLARMSWQNNQEN